MATRYHSLAVQRESLPPALEVTAEADDGVIMGLRHRDYAVEGVQFHPEAILTEHGHELLRNFLELPLSRATHCRAGELAGDLLATADD